MNGQGFECITCPTHGDGVTVLNHLVACDDACFDTHPYWHPRAVEDHDHCGICGLVVGSYGTCCGDPPRRGEIA